MEAVNFSFDIEATEPGCGFVLSVDQNILLDIKPGTEKQTMSVLASDLGDGKHTLEFSMYGKSTDHTKIGPNGEILEDLVITVSKICVDDINISSLISGHSTYYHNFNNNRPYIVRDRFFGTMGCNGTVYTDFECPIYTWLLEKL